MGEPRVFGWPCPWSGDDREPAPRAYRVWFWLYATNQRLRHRVGLHQKPRTYSISPRCDWCGHRSQRQRMFASRMRAAYEAPTPPDHIRPSERND